MLPSLIQMFNYLNKKLIFYSKKKINKRYTFHPSKFLHNWLLYIAWKNLVIKKNLNICNRFEEKYFIHFMIKYFFQHFFALNNWLPRNRLIKNNLVNIAIDLKKRKKIVILLVCNTLFISCIINLQSITNEQSHL